MVFGKMYINCRCLPNGTKHLLNYCKNENLISSIASQITLFFFKYVLYVSQLLPSIKILSEHTS